MRLKTQSHLITVALTGLIVWQIADASRPAAPSTPATEAPEAASTEAPEAEAEAKDSAPQAHRAQRRVRAEVPASRPTLQLVQSDQIVVEAVADERGEVRVKDLVQQLADSLGLTFTIDSQAVQHRVNLGGLGSLNRAQLRSVLRTVDVMVVFDPAGVLKAYSVRNIGQLEPPPWKLVEGGEFADPDQLVTRVIPIYHGAGNAIFATLRGLATRDTARISNSLYVPGSEVIIVSDLAANVAYYESVVHSLDLPAPPLADDAH